MPRPPISFSDGLSEPLSAFKRAVLHSSAKVTTAQCEVTCHSLAFPPFPSFNPPWTDLSCLSSAGSPALPGAAARDVLVKGMLQAAPRPVGCLGVKVKAESAQHQCCCRRQSGRGEQPCWEWILVLKGCTSTFQFVHKPPCTSIIWQLAFLGLIFNPQVGVRSLRISSPLELFSLHKGST